MSVQSYFETIASDFDSYYETPSSWFQGVTNHTLRKPCILKRLELALRILDREPLKTILDIGCGSGVLSIPLAQRGHRITAIDFSAPMIGIAQRKAREAGVSSIQWAVKDFISDEFEPVDACVALGVLEYFPRPTAFIQKMLELLPPEGVAVFDLPQLCNLHTLLRIPYLLWRRQRAYFYTRNGVARLLEPIGDIIHPLQLLPYGAGWLVILTKRSSDST